MSDMTLPDALNEFQKMARFAKAFEKADEVAEFLGKADDAVREKKAELAKVQAEIDKANADAVKRQEQRAADDRAKEEKKQREYDDIMKKLKDEATDYSTQSDKFAKEAADPLQRRWAEAVLAALLEDGDALFAGGGWRLSCSAGAALALTLPALHTGARTCTGGAV